MFLLLMFFLIVLFSSGEMKGKNWEESPELQKDPFYNLVCYITASFNFTHLFLFYAS